MYLHRSTVGIVVQAPAKLNLFFEVLAKRSDGYHEIETLMVPIDLYDTLFFQEDSSGQIELDCRSVIGRSVIGRSVIGRSVIGRRLIGPESSTDRSRTGMDLGELPQGAANLVVRAVELLRRRAGVRRGAKLRLVKRIPTAAGLGGGSSDAAAALVAANIAWGLGWSRAELARVAAELGSDVPFFLGRGPAVCRGRGERVEPVAGLGALHFVVVRPPVALATVDVYNRCRPARHARPLAPILRALAEGDLPGTGRLMFNRLQPVAKQLCRWIGELERELERQDCLGHLMSGSGSCCFGLCRHARHAKRVAGRLQADGIGLTRAVRGSK